MDNLARTEAIKILQNLMEEASTELIQEIEDLEARSL
jgi:hypothetical protein